MHVMIYSDDPGIGGVAQFDHIFSLGLIKAGFRAGLVQTTQHSPQAEERVRAGVEHHWLDYDTVAGFTRTFTNMDEPAALFDRACPDFILFSDSCPVSNYAAKRVARARGIPYAARVGFVAPYLAERFVSVLPVLGELYADAKAVVAVSRENLGLMERLFRLPPHRGRVIYSGKGEAFFRASDPADRQRRRASLGVPEDGVLCFTAARLEAVKGYQYQLSAIETLRTLPVWDRLHFAWAGPGSLQGEIAGAIARRGLSDRIHLLGQCWDVPAWLDAADVFVLPAQAEGLPQAVMEAMAKRLPVVSTRVSGIPEALADTGILLPDPQTDEAGVIGGLVRSIAELAVDQDGRRAMGEACYRRADRHFRAERMIADYIALITGPGEPVSPAGAPPPDLFGLLARHTLPMPGETRPFRPHMGGNTGTGGALPALWSRYRDELDGLNALLAARGAETAGLGLPEAPHRLDGEMTYILLRETRPGLVHEVGCGWGEITVYALAALTRNGHGRIEMFEADSMVAGLPIETALRCALVPGCDASRHHLIQGDPRRTVPARLAAETPDVLLLGPLPDETMAEWAVKALLPRVSGPILLRGVLHAGPRPADSMAALHLLSWLQHAGTEPLALALEEKELGRTGSASALLLLGAASPSGAAAGLDAAVARLLDGGEADARFPLTSERLRPGSIRAHRWDARMPPENRFGAVWHAGVFDRSRFGLTECLVVANRVVAGLALPDGLLDDLAGKAAALDAYTATLLLETAIRAGNATAAGRVLDALTATPATTGGLPERIARAAAILGRT